MRFKLLISLLVLLVAGGIYFYYRKAHPVPVVSFPQAAIQPVNSPRTYIIGLDGASWNLIDPLMKKGKLPNLKKLIDNGVRANLKSDYPAHSAFLWTTIATGKTKEKHGIGDFTVKGDEDQLLTGNVRRVKAFWNMLSEKGVSVSVVNWWLTFPPEKVNGVMISDHYRLGNYRKKQMVVTYPALLQKNLALPILGKARFELDSKPYGLPELRDVTQDGQVTAFDRLLKSYPDYWCQDAYVREASRYVLQHYDSQVFAVVFRITDVSSHFFWCYLPPNVLEEARKKEADGTLTKEDISRLDEQFSEIVGPVYSYADSIVGDIVKTAPPGSTFILVSDHGFAYYHGSWSHTTQPVPPDGILILSGGPYRKAAQVTGATIYDVTPTLLYQLHLPVADDFDGHVLRSAFTDEFAGANQMARIPTWETPGVKRGQEKPIVTPDDEQIKEDLRSLGYIH